MGKLPDETVLRDMWLYLVALVITRWHTVQTSWIISEWQQNYCQIKLGYSCLGSWPTHNCQQNNKSLFHPSLKYSTTFPLSLKMILNSSYICPGRTRAHTHIFISGLLQGSVEPCVLRLLLGVYSQHIVSPYPNQVSHQSSVSFGWVFRGLVTRSRQVWEVCQTQKEQHFGLRTCTSSLLNVIRCVAYCWEIYSALCYITEEISSVIL